MIFRTEIEDIKKRYSIGYDSKIMMIGSCFTENIGIWLKESFLDINYNPTGIMYNPVSVYQTLKRILSQKKFTNENLFLNNGYFNSFYHHSFFSDSDDKIMINNINNELARDYDRLKNLDYLFITFGTAWVFELMQESEYISCLDYEETSFSKIVGNCHKLPASLFKRRRLSVDEIYNLWLELIDELKLFNPNLKIIFTVSPIRHIKDTLHGNQISKSTLLLSLDRLCERYDNVDYFPAYEILNDDLRDYRFYANDMVHPSDSAITYIKEKFAQYYFSKETLELQKECLKFTRALNHKPKDGTGESYLEFLTQNMQKLELLIKKYHYITLYIPLNKFKHRIENIRSQCNTDTYT